MAELRALGPAARHCVRALAERLARLAPFAAFFVGSALALRIALLVHSRADLALSAGSLGRIFALGAVFDGVALAHLALPAAIYLVLATPAWLAGRAHRRLAFAATALAAYVVLFSLTAEWFFWDEFESRFNFIAVDYLVYTREVIGNIAESYPLKTLLAALLALALAAAVALTRRRPPAPADAPFGARAASALALAVLPALCFAWVDLAWSDHGSQRVANELAQNGLYSFFSALRRNELNYQDFYVTRGAESALREARRLVVEPSSRFLRPAGDDLARKVVTPAAEARANVVMIVVESLSAEFLGSFGGRKGLTPNLDRLAADSLLFTRLYATGNRTVRGIEALTLSVPPTPGQSIVRRPDNGGLFSLGAVLRDHGYRTRFLYGGYGYFDDMNDFFSANGFEVTDRTDLAKDEIHFENIWGVCDEDLFGRVARQARADAQSGRPFFSFVLTTSNHRPFTYPEGRIDLPSGLGRDGGVKYTDFAIGRFLAEAQKEPWFRDTLFLIVADHGAGTSGRVALEIERYHIPMLIWAPGRITPRRVDTLASQIDVAPTLLALLGFDYESKFFGRDILAMRPEDGRALPATYERLGLWRGDDLLVLGPRRSVAWERVRGNRESEPSGPPPHADALLSEAVAYYEAEAILRERRQDRWDGDSRALAAPLEAGR